MRDHGSFVRGSITPSLSMLTINYGGLVRRFLNLVLVLGRLVQPRELFALAIDRWMDELEIWFVAAYGYDDRELRNHNPWGDTDLHSDPVAFEQ